MSQSNSGAAKRSLQALGVLSAIGAGVLAYSLAEARSYRLRGALVPVLEPGSEPMRILHLSDLHMTPRQSGKLEWIEGLSRLEPDLVVATGDFMSHPDAVYYVTKALGPLLDLPGVFVLGSNDYYAPALGNPFSYLTGPSRYERGEPDLPWMELKSALSSGGWIDLSNRRDAVKVGGRLIDVRGVDDPHIGRDDYAPVAGPFDPTADLSLGVAHAPYLRVLDEMADDGAQLIMAGHTHGGQVCIPGYGALVTNCDIDTARVKGLHHHRNSWLHISAGLGTNPMTPVRLACPPEATLLTLVERG